MDNNITVTRMEDTRTFEALRNDWTTLLNDSGEKDIFLTWEWLFAWWKNFGQHPSNQLWLLTVRDEDRLIGIAPFMLNRKKKFLVSLRRLENIGNPECDVGGIISIEPEKTASAIFNYLTEHAHEWDVLELNELSASSLSTRYLLDVIGSSRNGLIQSSEPHFFIPINGTWDDYYAGLSKNLRHNLKRRKKRAEEMGDVIYNRFSGESLTWETFQTIFQISKKSNFPDLYDSDRNCSFHKDLYELMRDAGWLQIEILTIRDKPVAFQYGFVFDNRYEDWRGGIDKDYEILAPGKLLMMLSLERRFKSGIRESDFLRGIYSHKTDWLPSSREYVSIKAFNAGSFMARLAYYRMRYFLKNKSSTHARND
jgi:CelD/BcsL family acetyltransferase involved in cellulose biosynthesis